MNLAKIAVTQLACRPSKRFILSIPSFPFLSLDFDLI